jgi:hypothetical protein
MKNKIIALVIILTISSCSLFNKSYTTYSGCPVNTPRYFFKKNGTRMTWQYRQQSITHGYRALNRYKRRVNK